MHQKPSEGTRRHQKASRRLPKALEGGKARQLAISPAARPLESAIARAGSPPAVGRYGEIWGDMERSNQAHSEDVGSQRKQPEAIRSHRKFPEAIRSSPRGARWCLGTRRKDR